MMKRSKSLASRIWAIVLPAVILSSGILCAVSLIQAKHAIRNSTRQRMIDIANCASGSVNGDVLKRITKDDIDSDDYREVYDSLAVFRDNIESEYVYGIKEENGRFTFTVDPALNDPAEFGSEVVSTDALVMASRGTAAADEEPYTDQWGQFYSAYSPVRDSKGGIVGIIGVDFSREWYEGQQREQTRETIIMYLFILVFTLFVIGVTCYSQIKTITDPMVHITQVAREYQDGDFSGKLEIERDDELGVLSRALQSMATSLTDQIEVAEKANEAKSIFLANMSHEIRTPINAMLGNNEMIFRESEDPSIREFSQNVRSAGKDLLGMVDELLAYSKDGTKPAQTTAHGSTGPTERFTAKDARILAVDDNPMNLQVFLNLVKRTGIKVDTADNGDEGIRLATENKYDVLVLDHMMPEKDGIETLAGIREDKEGLNATTPAVCLTANAIPGAREYYISSGFDDYLTKPVDPNALEGMLRTYIPDEKIEIVETEDEAPEDKEIIPEKLENIRGQMIDIDEGIRNNGTVDSYMSLLKMFLDSVDSNREELDRLFDGKDIKNYTIKIHALKSSLRIIGAGELGEKAQNLEDAGKRNDTGYIRNHRNDFVLRYMKIKDVLSQLFDEEDQSEKPEADPDLMKDAIERIKSAAEAMDCDDLEEIFDEMKEYRIPQNDAQLFGKLKAASERFEYGTILELLG